MKKLTPYIISYLIIGASAAACERFYRHINTDPYFKLRTTMSHDELVTKLQQIGISESSVHLVTVTPAPFVTLVFNFGLYAFIFAAFLGLAYLIERIISKPRL
jgi:hypothetical protein